MFINNIEGYVFFAVILIILLIFKQKNKILMLLLTFVLYLGTTSLIKIIVARPRPFTKFDFQDFGEGDINRSFPSGHATAATSIIRFLEFDRILFYVWIFITILVMFSRIYLGMHYLSDVIAGFVLGYFVSDLSIFLFERLKRRNPKYF
jgi:undecaprenyl-diphosphatase